MRNEGTEGAIVASPSRESEVWHPYLNDQEDVVGSVALALHFASIFDEKSETSFKDIVSDRKIFNDVARLSYRLAAEKLVDASLSKNIRVREQINKSDDPLYLLLKSVFSDHAHQVERRVSNIASNTSLSKQIIISAASGLIVSVFIVASILFGGSVQDILHKLGK